MIYALGDEYFGILHYLPSTGHNDSMAVGYVLVNVTPGMEIGQIVPETDDLVIEARVSPNDIDRVAIGQRATIRFSTFGNGTVPTIFGKLINISADTFLDQYTGGSYYLARVNVSEESLVDMGDLALMPGMPAEIFIATGSRTFFEYIFKPFSNAMARGLRED